jgi:hypothetical protein
MAELLKKDWNYYMNRAKKLVVKARKQVIATVSDQKH